MLPSGCRWGFVAVAVLIGGAGTAPTQVIPGLDRSEWSGAQFVPQDRQTHNLLERARAQLTDPEGDWRRGLELVQRIMDGAEDHFSDRQLGGSLRGSAESLLAGLPADGRRLYEQLSGDEARALQEAAAASDFARLDEVVRRYFFTRAGREAAFTKAATEMDRGHFLTAARLFERLWRLDRQWSPPGDGHWERSVIAYWKAGFPQKSEALWQEAVAGESPVSVWRGGPIPSLPSHGDVMRWLQQQLGDAGPSSETAVADWLVPGGTADRNASAVATSPLFDNAWRSPLLAISDAKSPDRLSDLQIAADSVINVAKDEPQWQTYAVPEPLVVGETVLFSSYGRIKAVDAQTGKFRWQAADADPVFEYLAQGSETGQSASQPLGSSALDAFVAQRAWLDATSASLSSDTHRVYEVFDSGMLASRQSYAFGVTESHPLSPPSYNRLRAYDIRTEGKLLWEVGGPTGRVSLPLAGTFFLGAPLPVAGSLYVLGEERGQVRLIVLDPETGDVRWSLALLNTAADINKDYERRLAGLSPSQSGGMLICPTGGGMVVAVDFALRSLLWAHVYEEPKPSQVSNNVRGRFPQFGDPASDIPSTRDLLAARRWHGPAVLIAGRFVLLTPSDHAALHCVTLLDGQPLWSRPRQRLMSQAGVYRDAVILIGERHVEAAQIETGETIWSLPLGMPGGRGVREGHLLHVPLRGGEVATVDLGSGRLLARSATRSGSDLGSLVAAGGRLFSQTATELRGFRSLDEVEQQIAADLAVDPGDPAALSVRGEQRLHAGQTDDALADLRTSFKTDPDDRVKGLVVSTLLERLREDFVAHRDTVPELDRLTSDPGQRIQLERTIAEGLEAEGDFVEAYGRYLQMLALEGLASHYEHLSDEHTVRLDRWVQGRLQQLYERTAPADRPRLDEPTVAVVESVVASGEMDLLFHAASSFNWHPAGQRALQVLTDRIDPQQNPLRAEALWLKRRREGTPEQRAEAASRLVRLYGDHGRGELADSLLRELSGQYADVSVSEDATGSEIAAALREEPSVQAALADVIDWPTASVQVSKRQAATRQQHTIPLPLIGPVDPLFTATSFQTDSREVTAFDGFGRPEWTDRSPSRSGFGLPQSAYVERRGHRAVLFFGDRFRLIDMLGDQQKPRTIVEGELIEWNRQDRLGRATRLQIGPPGLRGRWRSINGTDDYLGNLGPLTDDLLCYQVGATVFAVDPFNGDELWHVDGLPRGCEILADEQYVVLVPPDPRNNRQEARVFRAADGMFIATRRLPIEIERFRQNADWGRMFLTKTKRAGTPDVLLAMFDPVAGENLWERLVPRFHSWAPLDGRDLVVLDEAGHMALLDADTGEIRFETQTEISPDVKSMTVVGHPDEWFLFTEKSRSAKQDSRIILPNHRQEYHTVNGMAYAFDRQTHEQLWSRELLSLFVDPELPGRWPVLVLSAEALAVPAGGGRAATRFQNLLLLDKRTGNILFEGDGTGHWQGTAWAVSEDSPQLLLSFGGTVLAVSFDEEPPEDETPSDRKPGNETKGDGTNRDETPGDPADEK